MCNLVSVHCCKAAFPKSPTYVQPACSRMTLTHKHTLIGIYPADNSLSPSAMIHKINTLTAAHFFYFQLEEFTIHIDTQKMLQARGYLMSYCPHVFVGNTSK